jgi:hypothetical protein
MKQLCAILLLWRSFITPKGQLQKKERKKERKKKEGKCPTRKMNSKGLDLDAKDEKNVHPVLRV